MNNTNSKLFCKGKVLIFEDEEKLIRRLTQSIQKNHSIIFHIARDISEFENYLSNEEPDTSSLDLCISQRKLTEIILNIIKRNAPRSCRVVYSAYDDEFEAARNFGADGCFLKGQISVDEYVAQLEKSVCTGINRKIYSHLRKKKITKLPIIKREITVPSSVEIKLKDSALSACYNARISRKSDFELEHLLKRRCWWANFDFNHYFRMQKSEKLQYLAGYAGLNADEIGVLLNIKHEKTETFETADFEIILKRVNKTRINALFTILSFLLKISSYELPLMENYMNATELYHKCHNPPPWDKIGLHKYLQSDTENGLFNAYQWLRSI